MTDLELRLREHLHDRLDGVEAGTLLPTSALRAGRRARTRRTATVAAAVVVAVAGGAAGAIELSRTGSSVIVPAGSLSERTVEYAEQIAAGNYEPIRSDMTDGTRAALTEERFREVWARVLDQLGPYESAGRSVVEPQPPGTTVRVPLRFRDGRADLRVTYRGDGQVIGVTLLDPAAAPTTATASQEQVARAVVRDLAAGRFELVRARFDARMTAALPEDRLREAWDAVAVVDHGGFMRISGITARRAGSATVLDVLCEMRNGAMLVRVAFDEKGRVSGLFLLEA